MVNVRFGFGLFVKSAADVRFTHESGHWGARFGCPLCATRGHSVVHSITFSPRVSSAAGTMVQTMALQCYQKQETVTIKGNAQKNIEPAMMAINSQPKSIMWVARPTRKFIKAPLRLPQLLGRGVMPAAQVAVTRRCAMSCFHQRVASEVDKTLGQNLDKADDQPEGSG
jgi:hypothetical protein